MNIPKNIPGIMLAKIADTMAVDGAKIKILQKIFISKRFSSSLISGTIPLTISLSQERCCLKRSNIIYSKIIKLFYLLVLSQIKYDHYL